MFLLWGAWVLASSMVAMGVSVLLCAKSPPVGNFAEPPFKRISGLYRPETGSNPVKSRSRTEKGAL